MGYTPGLPPGIYAPHTKAVEVVSNIFEASGSIGDFLESPLSTVYTTRTVLVFNSPSDVPPMNVASYITEVMFSRGLLADKENKPVVRAFPNLPVFSLTFSSVEEAKAAVGLSFEISFRGNSLDIKAIRKDFELPVLPTNIQNNHPRRVVAMNVDTQYIKLFPQFLYDHFDLSGYFVVPTMNDCVIFDVSPPITPEAAALMINGVQFGRFTIRATAMRSSTPRKTDSIGEYNVLANGVDVQQIMQKRTKIITATDNIAAPGRFLFVLNVIPAKALNYNEETQILIYDICEECKKYSNVLSCKVGNEKSWGACGRYAALIMEFETNEDAVKVQEHIAGRRYLGRTVITMLKDKIPEKT